MKKTTFKLQPRPSLLELESVESFTPRLKQVFQRLHAADYCVDSAGLHRRVGGECICLEDGLSAGVAEVAPEVLRTTRDIISCNLWGICKAVNPKEDSAMHKYYLERWRYRWQPHIKTACPNAAFILAGLWLGFHTRAIESNPNALFAVAVRATYANRDVVYCLVDDKGYAPITLADSSLITK